MAEVVANSEDLAGLSRSVVDLMEFAVDVVGCLADSGDHGTRQGLAVRESTGEFNNVLVPALFQAIDSVRLHAEVTLGIAVAVSAAETSTMADVTARQTNAENALANAVTTKAV